MKFNKSKLANLQQSVEFGLGALRRLGQREQDVRRDISNLELRIAGHWITQNRGRYEHFNAEMRPELVAEHKALTDQLAERKAELSKIRAQYETEDHLQGGRVESLRRCRDFLEPYGIILDRI